MALSDIRNRVFKPNWRSPHNTILNGELDGVSQYVASQSTASIDSYINDWRHNRNLIYAGELLGAAVTNNFLSDPSVKEAAEYILTSPRANRSEPLYDLADSLLQGSAHKPTETEHNDNLPSLSDYSNTIRHNIHFQREQVRLAPYNAFRRMELARAYMYIGQRQKACREASIAAYLAPDNRYVTRSAVRCFLHNVDYDKAHSILSANSALKTDPWLLATDISVDIIRGKSPRNAITASRVLRNGNFSPKSLTETAIALATLETNNGGRIKSIRDYVRKALVAPIDNSMAQAQWLSRYNPAIILPQVDTTAIKFSFEIETYKAIGDNDYNSAFANALKWLRDSGYSHRAAVTASNIAATFLNNAKESIAILEIALIANPQSPILLNNLAYQLMMTDELERAQKEISKVNYSLNIPNDTLTCLKATNGLLKFRQGDYLSGENFYNEAIEMARHFHDYKHECIARINLFREKGMSGIITKEDAIEGIKKIKSTDESVNQQIINAINILSAK